MKTHPHKDFQVLLSILFKIETGVGMETQAYNPSTKEAEAGGSLGVQGHSWL